MSTSMIDDMYSKRTRNSLSKIKSPRKNLEFEQLQIYYQSRGLTLNDKFAESLELLTEEDKYNYIAYLLADENSISIKVAKYAGIDKVDLIENEEYGYCSLIKAAKQVLDKLEIENKTTTRITRKERVEQKLINTIALREAVINAFVHNDYSSDVPPVIEIYSNRIEITSYGGLVSGMSENDFFSCKSMPRNRELIRVFKDVGLVEQLGSGMSRILKVYDKNVFEITENFLVVKFMFNKLVNEPLNELVNEPLNELVNNTLSLNERKVLEIIKKDDKLTIKELSKKIKKSESTIKRIIALLKDKDLIQREGPDKNGKWIIK